MKREVRSIAVTSVVPIVNDGAIAGTGVHLGKMVPALILDSTAHPNVKELLHVARHSPPGDVESMWAVLADDQSQVALNLHFPRPFETDIVIVMGIRDRGILVDQILNAAALWLLAGQPGDRISHAIEEKADRLLVGVVGGEFREKWDDLFHKEMASELHERGLSRRASRRGADELIAQLRQIGDFRMPR